MNDPRLDIVRNFLSHINFNDPKSDWTYNEILEGLRASLGDEMPGLDIVYKRESFLNEISGDIKTTTPVDKIVVIFTGIDDKLVKYEHETNNNY
jgi:hypothetical protein